MKQETIIYVIKKNRWFGAGILNIGLKKSHRYTDNILSAKYYTDLKEAEHALNLYRENNILPLYKGQWKIKKYGLREM